MPLPFFYADFHFPLHSVVHYIIQPTKIFVLYHQAKSPFPRLGEAKTWAERTIQPRFAPLCVYNIKVMNLCRFLLSTPCFHWPENNRSVDDVVRGKQMQVCGCALKETPDVMQIPQTLISLCLPPTHPHTILHHNLPPTPIPPNPTQLKSNHPLPRIP